MATTSTIAKIREIWRDCKDEKDSLMVRTPSGDSWCIQMLDGELLFTNQAGEVWEADEFVPFELTEIYSSLMFKYGKWPSKVKA
jgi:hypothetical protein